MTLDELSSEIRVEFQTARRRLDLIKSFQALGPSQKAINGFVKAMKAGDEVKAKLIMRAVRRERGSA